MFCSTKRAVQHLIQRSPLVRQKGVLIESPIVLNKVFSLHRPLQIVTTVLISRVIKILDERHHLLFVILFAVLALFWDPFLKSSPYFCTYRNCYAKHSRHRVFTQLAYILVHFSYVNVPIVELHVLF